LHKNEQNNGKDKVNLISKRRGVLA